MLGGWISRAVTLFLVLFASVVMVSAQIDRGTIQGVVRDQTGAVIPGAKIQIIRIDTNSTLDLATNEEGLYTAPNLPVVTTESSSNKPASRLLNANRSKFVPAFRFEWM